MLACRDRFLAYINGVWPELSTPPEPLACPDLDDSKFSAIQPPVLNLSSGFYQQGPGFGAPLGLAPVRTDFPPSGLASDSPPCGLQTPDGFAVAPFGGGSSRVEHGTFGGSTEHDEGVLHYPFETLVADSGLPYSQCVGGSPYGVSQMGGSDYGGSEFGGFQFEGSPYGGSSYGFSVQPPAVWVPNSDGQVPVRLSRSAPTTAGGSPSGAVTPPANVPRRPRSPAKPHRAALAVAAPALAKPPARQAATSAGGGRRKPQSRPGQAPGATGAAAVAAPGAAAAPALEKPPSRRAAIAGRQGKTQQPPAPVAAAATAGPPGAPATAAAAADGIAGALIITARPAAQAGGPGRIDWGPVRMLPVLWRDQLQEPAEAPVRLKKAPGIRKPPAAAPAAAEPPAPSVLSGQCAPSGDGGGRDAGRTPGAVSGAAHVLHDARDTLDVGGGAQGLGAETVAAGPARGAKRKGRTEDEIEAPPRGAKNARQ